MTTTTASPSHPSTAPARGELLLLHRRALHATADVVERALTYGDDDPEVVRLVRAATLANLWAAEHLGRWSQPAAPADETLVAGYRRSIAVVDEAACGPGALAANVPLETGAVGDGAELLAERIVALDRTARALAAVAAVHRTVDLELDVVVTRLVARRTTPVPRAA